MMLIFVLFILLLKPSSSTTSPSHVDQLSAIGQLIQTGNWVMLESLATLGLSEAKNQVPSSTSSTTIDSVPKINFHYYLAVAFTQLGRVQEAIPIFEIAVVDSPNDSEIIGSLAECYLMTWDLINAATFYQRAADVYVSGQNKNGHTAIISKGGETTSKTDSTFNIRWNVKALKARSWICDWSNQDISSSINKLINIAVKASADGDLVLVGRLLESIQVSDFRDFPLSRESLKLFNSLHPL